MPTFIYTRKEQGKGRVFEVRISELLPEDGPSIGDYSRPGKKFNRTGFYNQWAQYFTELHEKKEFRVREFRDGKYWGITPVKRFNLASPTFTEFVSMYVDAAMGNNFKTGPILPKRKPKKKKVPLENRLGSYPQQHRKSS